MKCSKCNEPADHLNLISIDNEPQQLCDQCFIKMHPKFDKIEKLDQTIRESTVLICELEKLKSNFDESSFDDYDESIKQVMFTPSNAMVFAKTMLDDLLNQKKELLEKMDDQQRYAYLLKNAIENEEYELAAELRDKINSKAKDV